MVFWVQASTAEGLHLHDAALVGTRDHPLTVCALSAYLAMDPQAGPAVWALYP